MFIKNTALLLGLLLTLPVIAHEYWFEPLQFSIEPGEKLMAHEKVGSNFKGNEYSYLPTSYVFLNLTQNGETRPVKSRIGDLPAINEVIDKQGLLVISATTTASHLTYEKAEKFNSFLKNQGNEWVLEKHQKRGLPEKGFTESYRRFPKTLVKVGNGEGQDEALGLLFEWLIKTNPYVSKEGPIKAQLLWKGKPVPNKRVNIFNRVFKKKDKLIENSTLIKTHLTTDKEGIITIPRAQGGLFLISAVKMIEAPEKEAQETGAVWESLWASSVYKLE